MRIPSRLPARTPADYMIDFGTDRGFLFAWYVWNRPEFRGRRAQAQRESRVIYAEDRRKSRAVREEFARLKPEIERITREYGEALMRKKAA